MEDNAMTDEVTPPPESGPFGIAGAQSNDESIAKKRRQQGKQACQQCRRRKIKVSYPLPVRYLRVHHSSLHVSQCDETRPHCRPCFKAKLSCAYELPAGQTRQQALMENQHKIQHELEAHASLIHTLRCLPSDASVRVLNALREGAYDGVLLGTGGISDATELIQSGTQPDYPWEYSADDGEQDAIGEDEDTYTENAASPEQGYMQDVASDMHMEPPIQRDQQGALPYPMAPRLASGLPYPGYYAPYAPYSGEIGEPRQDGIGLQSEGGAMPKSEQNQYSPPQPQQLRMKAPSQYPSDMTEDSSRTGRRR